MKRLQVRLEKIILWKGRRRRNPIFPLRDPESTPISILPTNDFWNMLPHIFLRYWSIKSHIKGYHKSYQHSSSILSNIPSFPNFWQFSKRGATTARTPRDRYINPYRITAVHRAFNPRVRVQFPIWIFLLFSLTTIQLASCLVNPLLAVFAGDISGIGIYRLIPVKGVYMLWQLSQLYN